MESAPFNPSQFLESLVAVTKNGGYNNASLVTGFFIQICLITGLVKSSFRDNHVTRLSWPKSFAFGVLFAVGAPVVSQIVSATTVWLAPSLVQFLDVLEILGRISKVEKDVADASRPWAYSFTILATVAFTIRRVRSLKLESFSVLHASHVALFLLTSNLVFQLTAYGIAFISR
jgi:hypothetical protein